MILSDMISERDRLSLRRSFLIKEINALKSENCKLLRRIRELNYAIEDLQQLSLPLICPDDLDSSEPSKPSEPSEPSKPSKPFKLKE